MMTNEERFNGVNSMGGPHGNHEQDPSIYYILYNNIPVLHLQQIDTDKAFYCN